MGVRRFAYVDEAATVNKAFFAVRRELSRQGTLGLSVGACPCCQTGFARSKSFSVVVDSEQGMLVVDTSLLHPSFLGGWDLGSPLRPAEALVTGFARLLEKPLEGDELSEALAWFDFWSMFTDIYSSLSDE